MAVGHVWRAIAVRDGNPEFHHNLGNILKEAGRQDEAAECYQRALDLGPTRSRRSPIMSVHFATAVN
ncbi:MAG: tetratricopeptide repeat protein [Alphaproteobacteria bacterium]|nr:tetratricopeptide repeat protein [Alphaproteobacteria bacterium]